MKKCYECSKDISEKEIGQGIATFDCLLVLALNEGWEFEGWVHINSTDNYSNDECFVREEGCREGEVHDAYINRMYERDMERESMEEDLVDRLIVCEHCVQKQYDIEQHVT